MFHGCLAALKPDRQSKPALNICIITEMCCRAHVRRPRAKRTAMNENVAARSETGRSKVYFQLSTGVK